ncbi:hypothetical protein ACFOY4_22335 [Actinomadura syzygii]|uniref:DUF1449 family protein n=1 Tax=Actinomadura syzygii TaxID=1427538 RepID=A0A5D0TXZ0_9ACTN|nr:hypothetical protein [Actinomadura syzygii]TYC09759.1 hypothetical protein FXF65_32025 [Actinomadura syzygii]
MVEFFDAALGFPTALFSFALLVVAGYWIVVLLGGLGIDALDTDADTGAGVEVEGGGFLGAAGLGGVPATVTLSLVISLAWFVSLAGSVLMGDTGGVAVHALLSVGVLLVALTGAWLCTRGLVRPLRRVFQGAAEPSRRDFVGEMCVIRTGRVGPDFGQAEVTSADGSSAIVQVRQPSADVPVAGRAGGTGLTAGSTALIFDYDPVAECFLVMPYEAPPRPDDPAA